MESIALIDERGSLTTSGILEPVPWWSFTKTVLSIAALRLVEGGSLSLTEPVHGERFSLAQLLRHEAGLPDYGIVAQYHEDVAAGTSPWPLERILAAVDADRLRYEPGTNWAYSNIGYVKVRELIERASQLPLSRALDQLVFEPAALTSARLAGFPADLAEVEMGDALSYHPGWVYHGLVTGTTADAARLLRALVSGSILQPQTLTWMLQGRALPQERSAAYPDPAYGLGIMLWATDPLAHPLGHSGEGPGSKIAVYANGATTCSIWETIPAQTNDLRVFELLEHR